MEIDHLFKSLVLPNFTYCLSVYGASEPDFNIMHFLDRSLKPRFVSVPVSINDLLYRQDCEILKVLTSEGNQSLDSNSPPKRRINKNYVKSGVPSPRLISNGS